MSKIIITKTIGRSWVWYTRKISADEQLACLPKEERVKGKYLFFSEKFTELEKIAEREIREYGFFKAKINTASTKIGKDFVLCLYWMNSNRGHELCARYLNNKSVRYRFWKSDEDTLKGKYSDQYYKDLLLKKNTWAWR